MRAGVKWAAPLANEIQLTAKVWVIPLLDTVQDQLWLLVSFIQMENTVIFSFSQKKSKN